MSSTLLFCDHTCYGQRTLYDCCHIGTIAAMLLENRFVRRHLYALLVESYKDCPSRALLGVSRGRAHIFPCVLLETWFCGLWRTLATHFGRDPVFPDCQVCL